MDQTDTVERSAETVVKGLALLLRDAATTCKREPPVKEEVDAAFLRASAYIHQPPFSALYTAFGKLSGMVVPGNDTLPEDGSLIIHYLAFQQAYNKAAKMVLEGRSTNEEFVFALASLASAAHMLELGSEVINTTYGKRSSKPRRED
ncbi:MAG: hypothetical protein H6502_01610 [Candidatus Woesearchaeota archaeon]|nr:MAG: hypothetical protein H6502_01610 [Candidatus Woesearchaeota archaeon]